MPRKKERDRVEKRERERERSCYESNLAKHRRRNAKHKRNQKNIDKSMVEKSKNRLNEIQNILQTFFFY